MAEDLTDGIAGACAESTPEVRQRSQRPPHFNAFFLDVGASEICYTAFMKRLLAVVTLLAGVVLPAPLVAQHHAFARPVASSPFRMGTNSAPTRISPVRPVGSPFRTTMMRPAPWGGWRGGSPRGPRPIFRPRHRFGRNPFFFGQPFATSFFWSPPFWSEPLEAPPDYAAPAAPPEQEDNGLANQLEQLTEEIQALRADQASRQDARAEAAPALVEQKPAAAVLVYHDGHQAEVHDYAVMGQTLWVFAGETTRRVSLADVNLEATNRLNDARGIDFALPNPR